MLSGGFDGAVQIVIYIFAFLAPTAAGIYFSKSGELKEKNEFDRKLKPNKGTFFVALLSVFPILLIILVLSYLSSLFLFEVFGMENGIPEFTDPLSATLIHAVLPSLLEEMAFRYLPLKVLAEKSPRVAVFASAFFFSLIHRSFFSIPYAFAAGLLFMALDIASGSIIPSVVIHLLNNVIALMTMGAYGFGFDTSAAFVFIGAGTLISSVFLFLERKKLAAMVKCAFAEGEKYLPSVEPLFFAVPALLIAAGELLV